MAFAMLAGLAAAGPLACASTVQVSERADFDFSSSRTYAWITDEPVLIQFGKPQPNVRTRANEALIRDAVDRELAAKGYTKVEHDDADLLVAFSVGVLMRYRVEGVSLGDAPGGRQTKGTLNLYFLDRKSAREVWHAYVSRWLSKSDDPKAVADGAVGRILAEFPAAPASASAVGERRDQ
jgi:hypothetical protein